MAGPLAGNVPVGVDAGQTAGSSEGGVSSTADGSATEAQQGKIFILYYCIYVYILNVLYIHCIYTISYVTTYISTLIYNTHTVPTLYLHTHPLYPQHAHLHRPVSAPPP